MGVGLRKDEECNGSKRRIFPWQDIETQFVNFVEEKGRNYFSKAYDAKRRSVLLKRKGIRLVSKGNLAE